MGRSTNTRQGISKERGHLHFEIDLRLNEKYAAWHKEKQAGQRNDHGNWNGKNFVGLDPRLILLEQHKLGDKIQPFNIHTDTTGVVPGPGERHKFGCLQALCRSSEKKSHRRKRGSSRI